MNITIIDLAWCWTFKDPETGKWIEDIHRYMTVSEAKEYFSNGVEYTTLPILPIKVEIPIDRNGKMLYLKARILE